MRVSSSIPTFASTISILNCHLFITTLLLSVCLANKLPLRCWSLPAVKRILPHSHSFGSTRSLTFRKGNPGCSPGSSTDQKRNREEKPQGQERTKHQPETKSDDCNKSNEEGTFWPGKSLLSGGYKHYAQALECTDQWRIPGGAAWGPVSG